MTHAELEVVLRAALAALLGLVIGWERTLVGAPTRARTFALAAATAAALIGMTETLYPEETARVVAGIVTGIGFLGAGAILRSPTGEVSGLTTAAGLWSMTAVGMAMGSGHVLLGVLLAFVIYVTMAISDWPVFALVMRVGTRRRKEPPMGHDAPSPRT
jgi:putative Mg2+ transporter-C (MgtC) family protein